MIRCGIQPCPLRSDTPNLICWIRTTRPDTSFLQRKITIALSLARILRRSATDQISDALSLVQTSRGKLDNLRRTPAEFTAQDFDGYGFRCVVPTRPAETASYSVSVRQVTTLLDASLKPCLAATLLRFANTSPPSGCVEDLHLQVVKHARHTKAGPIPSESVQAPN